MEFLPLDEKILELEFYARYLKVEFQDLGSRTDIASEVAPC